MKIKLLIATADSDYAEHLSRVLAEKYAEVFTITVCSTTERLQDVLVVNGFDAALLEPSFTSACTASAVRLPLLLADEEGNALESSMKKVRKYQRVSAIAGNIMEYYAEISVGTDSCRTDKAHITAVWSPSGGSGKTTVSLALAAHRVLAGKQAVYLNLESFASTAAYFPDNGKSISKAFEKLDTNVQMFLMGIRQQDSGSGILYFCEPENYDDMNILTAEDIETLTKACAEGVDEVVLDLPSQCDGRVQAVLAFADTVLVVSDMSVTSQVKLRQFISQHNVFGKIQSKAVLVNNKNAKTTEPGFSRTIQLPHVQSADSISIFKALSSGHFDW